MPRRNHRRSDRYEPLDLTPATVNANRPRGRRPSETFQQYIDRSFGEARQRAERQHSARINKGIDWSVCLVPGCGEDLVVYDRPLHHDRFWRDHTVALPLCFKHLGVAGRQASINPADPLLVEATTHAIERDRAKQAEEHENGKRAWLSNTFGDIYYLRTNGLIKVGWTRDLIDRLRAYGPDVEVLCHYPASRGDETNLHRQLRPFLAKGREWYQDCPALHDYVAQAVAKHGPPTASAHWTEPKTVKSAGVVYEFDPSVGRVGQAVRAWSSGSVTSSTRMVSTAWARARTSSPR